MRDSRRALYLSLMASLGVHAVGLYFLISHPILLRYSLSSLFGLSIPAPSYLEYEERQESKNKEIEEVFKQILVLSPHLQEPFDFALPPSLALAPQQEASPPLTDFEQALAALPEALVESERYVFEDERVISLPATALQLPQPSLTWEVNLSLDESGIERIHLPQEETLYIVDATVPILSESVAMQESSSDLACLVAMPPHLALKMDEKPLKLDTALSLQKVAEKITLLPHDATAPMRYASIELPSEISDYALASAYAKATEWNEDFDLDIAFLPHPEAAGYIFSLTLSPNFDVSQYSLKHNISFILDRTVRKHRFNVFTRAVAKALSCLQRGDTFNIYVVDDKLTRFNKESVTVTPKSIRSAEEFLERQSASTLYARGDIYASLEKVLPEITKDDSVHTAILLSDGISELSTRKQQRVLKSWMEKNEGKVCIYTAAVGEQNDLMMLDFLSRISGGKLLFSDTHAAFPRKLAKCVLDLKDPLATELIIEAHSLDPFAKVELIESASHMRPALFSHQPYTIIGSIDQPGPFELTIQGRHNDQWIAIKKEISFTDGVKADHKLLTEWSAQKAQKVYSQFLAGGNPSTLKEAREILKKAHQEMAQR